MCKTDCYTESQVNRIEEDAYNGAIFEAGKEWERQRDEFNSREHELQSRIAELEHDLSNKEIEYTDLWDDMLEMQSRIAELEALVERLIEAGDRLSDSLCTYPEEEKTIEVCNWYAIVAEYKECEK